MKTLLQKAKEVPHSKGVSKNVHPMTQQEISLSLAFLKGEVSLYAVAKVIGRAKKSKLHSVSAPNAYSWLMPRIRRAYKKGKIKIT